jgi:glycosyltransferase involved in cell wall biosynthesis
MSQLPLVSVIAINFNSEKYVEETLNSIRNQTYENFELIIIDDCSTDNSVAIIEKWLTDYHRPFQLILNEKNIGVCSTLNRAFHLATGKYVCATATDDLLMPDKLSIQVNLLETAPPDICAVYSDAYLINADGTRRDLNFIANRQIKHPPTGQIFENLLHDNFIPAMSVLLKTECFHEVGDFDEKLVYEDYDMWLRLARKYKFIFSNYISCKYRVRDKSLSTQIDWDIPNSKILLKHVHHDSLVLKKLQDTALRAYEKNKKSVFDILALSDISDKYIRRLILLHRFKIPLKLGIRLLPSTRA